MHTFSQLLLFLHYFDSQKALSIKAGFWGRPSVCYHINSAARPVGVSVTKLHLQLKLHPKKKKIMIWLMELFFLQLQTESGSDGCKTAAARRLSAREANPRDGIIIRASAQHTVGRRKCRRRYSLWQPRLFSFLGRGGTAHYWGCFFCVFFPFLSDG